MRGGLVLLVTAGIATAPAGVAHAGRSFFGWLYGSEVMPEKSVELQNWISEENRIEKPISNSVSTWGVGPFIGITDQLELGLPLDIEWSKQGTMPGKTALADYGVEARYRFVPQQDAPPFAPLVRVAVKRLVLARDVIHPEVDLVGTYEAGSVVAAVDLGVGADLNADRHDLELRPGVGVSVLVVDQLRLGGEAFAEIPVDGEAWAVVGPNMSWTHGRFWISATYGIGVYQIKDAPRVQWGIAF